MTFAIIGAGAIGSVMAARLAKAGKDVVLIARETYVDELNGKGITVHTDEGSENVNVKVLSRLDKEYDLVIFTTKTQDLGEAYQQNNEFMENCYVLTSQNGVQADSILGFHFEKEKMFSSIVMFGATLNSPGDVTINFSGDWIIGKPYTPVDERTHEVAKDLGDALSVVVSNNITGMKYLKLFVNFNNCIPALIGKSMQETFADLDLCRLSIFLLKEGVDLIQRAGIEMVSLPDFPVEKTLGLISMPIDQAAGIIKQVLISLSKEPLYGSILQSIKRGKVSEIEFINGEVVRLATQIRSQAPLNEKIVDMVHEVENKKEYFAIDAVKKEFNLL